MSVNGNPAMMPTTPVEVADALWQALLVQAQNLAVADDARNASATADACMKLAQAITLLDQTVISPQGVPPDVLAAAVPEPPPPAPEKKSEAKK